MQNSCLDHCVVPCTTLRKLVFHFLSNWMGYDRGDSFPFNFEPNGNPFGSKSKVKLSPRSYPIQCERKLKHNLLRVTCLFIHDVDSSNSCRVVLWICDQGRYLLSAGRLFYCVKEYWILCKVYCVLDVYCVKDFNSCRVVLWISHHGTFTCCLQDVYSLNMWSRDSTCCLEDVNMFLNFYWTNRI